MKYTLLKIAATTVILIFIVIGLALMVGGTMHSLLMGLAFVGIGGYKLVTSLRLLNKFQKKTYEWYKATHRLNVDGNRVTCVSCCSGRINVRSLLNHTYHREHFCGQSGTSIYFSPEAK